MRRVEMNLRLFDGAGAPATGTGAPAGTPSAGASATPAGKPAEKKVVYGIQDDVQTSEETITQPEQTPEETEEARQEAYKKFREENKDLFQAEIDQAINKRFKETRGLTERIEKLNPLMDMLAEKYNIANARDYDAIVNAYMNDPEQYQDIAANEGLTLEQAKRMRELETFKKTQLDAQNRANANATYQNWMQEASELQSVYPEFNIQDESENPQFTKLLRNGVSVKQAYEIIHPDALTQRLSAEIAAKQTANVRQRQSRPKENGLASVSGVEVRSDVSKFTAEDRRKAIAQSKARPGSVRFS